MSFHWSHYLTCPIRTGLLLWAGSAQHSGRGHALIRAGALRRRQNKEVFGLSVQRTQAESGSESCSRGRDPRTSRPAYGESVGLSCDWQLTARAQHQLWLGSVHLLSGAELHRRIHVCSHEGEPSHPTGPSWQQLPEQSMQLVRRWLCHPETWLVVDWEEGSSYLILFFIYLKTKQKKNYFGFPERSAGGCVLLAVVFAC